MEKSLSPEEFKTIYSKVPRLCVELVIKTDEGVLLTLRTLPSYHGLWHMPGVTLAFRESVSEAVRRVAKDELGIEIVIDSLLDFIEYINEDEGRGFGHAVTLVFLCHPSDPNAPIKLNEEASEYNYFKTLPDNIIKEHGEFLHAKGFIK